jgi:hypothetical protein
MGYEKKSNIIAVDWGKLSGPIGQETIETEEHYKNVAVTSVPIVSARINEFVTFLLRTKKVRKGSDVHLIGQSLGAHISGFVGKRFMVETGEKIGRITGSTIKLI